MGYLWRINDVLAMPVSIFYMWAFISPGVPIILYNSKKDNPQLSFSCVYYYFFKTLLTGWTLSSSWYSKTFSELMFSHWVLTFFKRFTNSNLLSASGSVIFLNTTDFFSFDISSPFKTIVGALIFIESKVSICRLTLSVAINELFYQY